MRTIQFKKLLPLVVLFSVILSGVSTAHSASIDELVATTEAIEISINRNQTLTTPVRNQLLTQVLIIQGLLANMKNRADLQSNLTTDLAEIAYIVNRYNDTSKTVTSEIHFTQSSTTVTRTLPFPELARATQPTARLLQMRQKVTTLYAQHFATSSRALGETLLFSARHPWRAAGLPASSDLDVLVGLIGTYSIVERVALTPGDGIGTLVVDTDQNERIIFEISSGESRFINDRLPKNNRSTVYDFTYSVDFSPVSDQFRSSISGNNQDQPVIFEREQGISRADILETLEVELAGFTQMDDIDDFPNKFLTFMTENQTALEVGDKIVQSQINRSLYQCFSDADKDLMIDFLQQFVRVNQYQVYPDRDTLQLYAPIIVSDDSRTIRCKSASAVFFD